MRRLSQKKSFCHLSQKNIFCHPDMSPPPDQVSVFFFVTSKTSFSSTEGQRMTEVQILTEPSSRTGTQFTYFTRTKVQTLTQKGCKVPLIVHDRVRAPARGRGGRGRGGKGRNGGGEGEEEEEEEQEQGEEDGGRGGGGGEGEEEEEEEEEEGKGGDRTGRERRGEDGASPVQTSKERRRQVALQ